MIGIPRYLNTKDDCEGMHQLALAGQIPAEFGIKAWRGLLAGAYSYRYDRDLAATEAPDGPEPDFIVLDVEQPDGSIVRQQHKLTRDTSSRMDRLGYTEADVQQKIAELGG